MSLWYTVLRWIARLCSLLVAGTFAMIVFSEIVNPHSGAPSGFKEWAGIGLMVLACAAMLAAWKWELTGAVLSLAAVGILLATLRFSSIPYALLVMGIPGALLAADSFARRSYRLKHRL